MNTSLLASPALALLRLGQPRLMTDVIQFSMLTALFVVIVIVVMVLVFKAMRSAKDHSAAAAAREEFEKSKAALLLAAQAKKAAHEADDSAKRQGEMEEKERELLRENVNPELYIGRNCPLCGLEMMDDQELVIDPYTGAAYHFSSFLNDWPVGQERPKYIYRYPQGTVVKSADLVRQY
jgi:hypothetical protein